jgi:hypothetical protein
MLSRHEKARDFPKAGVDEQRPYDGGLNCWRDPATWSSLYLITTASPRSGIVPLASLQ